MLDCQNYNPSYYNGTIKEEENIQNKMEDYTL